MMPIPVCIWTDISVYLFGHALFCPIFFWRVVGVWRWEEPGVVAHQLHSPKLHSSDVRHQASARSRPMGVSSVGTSRTGNKSQKSAYIS